MTGRHRSPRPPGNALILCTARGTHAETRVRTLQVVRIGDRLGLMWNTREGPAPVTGYRDAEGRQTYVLRCRRCRRNLKIREDKLTEAIMALAASQGIVGDERTPIRVDLSAVEAALC